MRYRVLVLTFLPVLVFSLLWFTDIDIAKAGRDKNHGSVQNSRVKAAEVTWYQDWNKGIEEARKKKRPVLVDFFAEWCVWCHVMDKKTFSAPEIKTRLANDWITIRLNMDDKKRHAIINGKSISYQQLAGLLGVVGLPSYLFIDKRGQPIHLQPGYIPKEQFGPLLDYIRDELYKKHIKFSDYLKSRS